jgi:NADPH-dependent 2,4-dienoyl-CoA reductase/sulfur reductase-like enzyme
MRENTMTATLGSIDAIAPDGTASIGVIRATPDAPDAVNGGERLPDRVDVAVIGGGLAGLAAAATAARAGRSVVLFEQASGPGGRGRTRSDHGLALNIRPHPL